MRFLNTGNLGTLAVKLWAAFACMNTLLFWSFFALWPSPNSDFGLRSATLNQWILGPLALLLWAPQFPSYALFDQLEKLHRFEALGSHVTVTLLSTAFYTGVIAWYRRHRGAAERCVEADKTPSRRHNG
jgi:hypothetical protein